MTNTKRGRVPLPAKAILLVKSTLPAASAPLQRKSRRLMLRIDTLLAAHEFWCGQKQGERLRSTRRARDGCMGRRAHPGSQPLRRKRRGISVRAHFLTERIRPLDALHERGCAVPVGGSVRPARRRARRINALPEERKRGERLGRVVIGYLKSPQARDDVFAGRLEFGEGRRPGFP